MIERYTRPEMGKIWTEEAKYASWLRVEVAVCEALSARGEIPAEALNNIKTRADFEVKRIDEIEAVTRHDIIAFLTNVAEYVGPDSRYIHLGLTSSDVLDTALALRLQEASALIMQNLENFGQALKEQAIRYKDTVMVGRSHGIHAEPVTLGLKFALWYAENERNKERMKRAAEGVNYGMLSGAVGTFANIDPDVEEEVCKLLGLSFEPVSTQVVQRDRHAEYHNTIAIIGTSLDKIATEIRLLQKTETREVEEPFAKGQKGSSAMPHKRNPIACENTTGLVRLLRAYAAAALENNVLWHERDISHSSVERVALADATILLDYAQNRMLKVVAGLHVYPENMERDLNLMRGLVYSQRVLLELAKKGCTREEAYALVQRNAMKVWEGDNMFKDLLLADEDIGKHLSATEIEGLFDINYHLRNVDAIFKRAGIL